MRAIQSQNKKFDIVIIGAGIAGSLTALELCDQGNRILLLELGSDIIGATSTSYNECYKLHTGLHYVGDLDTAISCLRHSVCFARQFPDSILGYQNPELPWRRGRHYLMSNSLFDKPCAIRVCEALMHEYARLVDVDPENKVFGEPDKFVQFLEKSDLSFVSPKIHRENLDGSSSSSFVTLGIQTPESQVDIKQLKLCIRKKILASSDITFLCNHEVVNIECDTDSFNYGVIAKDRTKNRFKKIQAKSIVNCSWQNIERIDATCGYASKKKSLIRVKASLLVRLPHELIDINTCIFFSGPHCSLTNQGDGTAIVTYEPITNVGYFDSAEKVENIPHDLRRMMSADLKPEMGIGKALSEGILNGAANYVPGLVDASVLEVRIGYVKIFSSENQTYSIYNRDSPIHQRIEDGIEEKGLCYISYSGMKLTYAANSAKKTSAILRRHLKMRKEMYAVAAVIRYKLISKIGEVNYHACMMDELLHRTLRGYMLEDVATGVASGEKLINPSLIDEVFAILLATAPEIAESHRQIGANVA